MVSIPLKNMKVQLVWLFPIYWKLKKWSKPPTRHALLAGRSFWGSCEEFPSIMPYPSISIVIYTTIAKMAPQPCILLLLFLLPPGHAKKMWPEPGLREVSVSVLSQGLGLWHKKLDQGSGWQAAGMGAPIKGDHPQPMAQGEYPNLTMLPYPKRSPACGRGWLHPIHFWVQVKNETATKTKKRASRVLNEKQQWFKINFYW